MRKGQGSLEYLLILAAILAIAVVVVIVANSMLSAPNQSNIVNQDKYNFAVAGFEVTNYNAPIDPANFIVAEAPVLTKDNIDYTYAYKTPAPSDSPIGSLTSNDGTKFNVYISEYGPNYYMSSETGECTPDCTNGLNCVNGVCVESTPFSISGINCFSSNLPEKGYYLVTGNINCMDAGFTFSGDISGSVFDCNGHKLKHGGAFKSNTAIKILNATDITIKNCKISTWKNAISFTSSASGGYVENNILWGNDIGININAEGIVLSDNYIFSNNDFGIYQSRNLISALTGNCITENTKDIYCEGTQDITGNYCNPSSSSGCTLEGTPLGGCPCSQQ